VTLALPGFEAPCDLALSQYDTPPALAAALCDLIPLRGACVLEPSAGRGNVVAAALDAGAEHVIAVELDPKRCAVLRDRFAREIAAGRVEVIERSFLDVRADDLGGQVYVIVGNPPYDDGADTEHVAHMLSLVAPDGDLALLLRTVFLHGQERRELIWSRVGVRSLEPVSARVKFGEEAGKIDVSLFHLVPRRSDELLHDVTLRFR
jgi:predicted RNA methylase